MTFEYDPAKSAANADKHGIDFEAAQAIWADESALVIPARSDTEPRFLVLGKVKGHVWAAICTERGPVTRIISVRKARRNEREIYFGRGV